MSNFKQEDRYLILKRKDIDDSLLDELFSRFCLGK